MDLDETWQVGMRPEKTKPCTFPAKSLYGFRREREKMGRRGVVFLWREPRTTSVTFLGSISAKLPTNTCPGSVSQHMVSYSRKVSSKGSNFPKNPLFRVPCLCSAYGSREMFCDAYTQSPSGHPTDVSFLGDFCWGMYCFPPICLRKSPYQQWGYLDGDTEVPPGERRDTTQYAYNQYK